MCIQVSCYKQNLLTSTCCFLRLKHPNFSASQLAHFGVGIRKARYTLLDFPQDKEFIMSNPCSPPPPPPSWRPKMNVSFMRESPARNRKKILKSRNSTSSHNSQTITSSLISAPALTSRGLDCVPYWNDQVADWSRRLWLPTETGSAGSPSTSSNSSSTLIAQGSWFSQMTIQRMNGNYHRISSPLTPSSSADSKESDLLGKYYLFTLSFT